MDGARNFIQVSIDSINLVRSGYNLTNYDRNKNTCMYAICMYIYNITTQQNKTRIAKLLRELSLCNFEIHD